MSEYQPILALLRELTADPLGGGEALLRTRCDTAEIDRFGNLLGIRRGTGLRVMLDAHLDQICLVVSGHRAGFLAFRQRGGVDPRILPGHRVRLPDGQTGVITSTPPHLQKDEDTDKSIPMDKLFIDTGLPLETARDRYPVGSVVTFEPGILPLGDHCASGSALDDRAGFAALLHTLTYLEDCSHELIFCGSTQEEVGLRGAAAAVWNLAPNLCVVVDVTHGDTPDVPADRVFRLDGGPAIGVGPNMHRGLTRILRETAERLGIPYQLEVMGGSTGTNGWVTQVARGGIPTVLVSIPERYMHTPVEVLSLRDMDNTARLIAAFLSALPEVIPYA